MLAADRGGLGTEADLDERTAAEMRSLGLYEAFGAAPATASVQAEHQPTGREG
ncbi:hypothetical protein GCM10009836_25030 [Pseudonocardia ailaonensis]|uniref:Uncharacterized protein n=1 Tax=Pseudonocardia ailaonensis TaxID=367279 RepID=A0ABN2MZZ5_9PSEU